MNSQNPWQDINKHVFAKGLGQQRVGDAKFRANSRHKRGKMQQTHANSDTTKNHFPDGHFDNMMIFIQYVQYFN
jgi:hypothetical protein